MSEPAVNSFNEWDPLEEVIVGIVEGSVWPPLELANIAANPPDVFADIGEERLRLHAKNAAKSRRSDPTYELARAELEEFVTILKGEGVTVRRPDPLEHAQGYSTPEWTSLAGRGQVVPRDILVVIGNEIIEAPMSQRSRFFEYRGYRTLLREYFRRGAKWTAAPKPLMSDELYKFDYKRGEEYLLTEFEPVFDAADISRFGVDIFVQRSHSTNDSGIEWLRRHLGPTYKVHTLKSRDERAMHIDATFVPLAPGKLLLCAERVPREDVPQMFKRAGWDILEAVPRLRRADSTAYRWFDMNVLSLDEKRVVVEASGEELIKRLKEWGMTPIPCNFANVFSFGGSFHCTTLDVRRRGTLKSYF